MWLWLLIIVAGIAFFGYLDFTYDITSCSDGYMYQMWCD